MEQKGAASLKKSKTVSGGLKTSARGLRARRVRDRGSLGLVGTTAKSGTATPVKKSAKKEANLNESAHKTNVALSKSVENSFNVSKKSNGTA